MTEKEITEIIKNLVKTYLHQMESGWNNIARVTKAEIEYWEDRLIKKK